jgi:glycosyltransferase involved in cell wall biosynthesis
VLTSEYDHLEAVLRLEMRSVLIFATSLARTQAGAAHATLDFANALARQSSAKVYVFTIEVDPGTLDPSIQVIFYTWPIAPSILNAMFRRIPHLYLVRQMIKELKKHKLPQIDVCYTANMICGLAFRNVYPNVPIVTHFGSLIAKREILEENNHPNRPWIRFDAFLANRIEGKVFRQPGWVHLAHTNLVAKQRENHFRLPEGSFQIAPYGVDFQRFHRGRRNADKRRRFGLKEDDVVVLSVSRLVSWKNTEMVLHAFAKCRSTSAILFVVGDGPCKERLVCLARELGIADRTRFTGRTPVPEEYYAVGDIFCLPSLIESFGLVYAEAMLMGLPCIGMRNDPPRVLSSAMDVIKEGETGFCISTLEELVERMNLLIEDRALRARLGQRGFEVACQNYSWEAYLDKFLTIFALIEGNRAKKAEQASHSTDINFVSSQQSEFSSIHHRTDR